MTSWGLMLVPTDRPSSLGGGKKQLSYRWFSYVSILNQNHVTLQPPVMANNDELRILFDLSALTPTAPNGWAVNLSIDGSFPAGVTVSEVNGTIGAADTCHWPPSGDYDLGVHNELETFRFRAVVTVTELGENTAATIYTVDPEMVVGPGEGSAFPPGGGG